MSRSLHPRLRLAIKAREAREAEENVKIVEDVKDVKEVEDVKDVKDVKEAEEVKEVEKKKVVKDVKKTEQKGVKEKTHHNMPRVLQCRYKYRNPDPDKSWHKCECTWPVNAPTSLEYCLQHTMHDPKVNYPLCDNGRDAPAHRMYDRDGQRKWPFVHWDRQETGKCHWCLTEEQHAKAEARSSGDAPALTPTETTPTGVRWPSQPLTGEYLALVRPAVMVLAPYMGLDMDTECSLDLETLSEFRLRKALVRICREDADTGVHRPEMYAHHAILCNYVEMMQRV